MMQTTPKSLRLQIGLFGRTNVGKSSVLNYIAGQDISIISSEAGTTTDVVEKSMELLPIGPVVFLDTAGLNDTSTLAEKRLKKTSNIFNRADIIILVTEPNVWTKYEDHVCNQANEKNIPVITIINKIDLKTPDNDFIANIKSKNMHIILCSCINNSNREKTVNEIKKSILEISPDEFLNPPTLIGDLINPGGIAVLIVPIDLQAPKGRLILPQVQTIRDALDNDSAVLVVKEREYSYMLSQLKSSPDLVICDSQVVLKMVADTPTNIKCTTFSILFSRYKGNLIETAKGASHLKTIKKGDKILISEACSHHALEDDIGRIKIPRWLKQYLGINVNIDVFSGRDFPENIKEYKLIIHCGGCMITRREMLFRIQKAREHNIPITNYGLCISFLQGVIDRVLAPFPEALNAYLNENKLNKSI